MFNGKKKKRESEVSGEEEWGVIDGVLGVVFIVAMFAGTAYLQNKLGQAVY